MAQMWKGNWKSTMYPVGFAYGTVATSIDFGSGKAHIQMRYDGVFQNGISREFDATVAADAKSAASELVSLHSVGNIQKITFEVTQRLHDGMTGKYTSAVPADQGVFSLVRASASS